MTIRRAARTVHLWAGLAIGAYVVAIGVTGALLVFRPELQAWSYPHLFGGAGVRPGTLDPDRVAALVTRHFPGERLSGIDYPGARRTTALVYLTSGDAFRAVFVDPAAGRVVGELPRDGWVQRLQDVHARLGAGRGGLTANGVGAGLLVLMTLTGVVIAWPGWRRLPRALFVSRAGGGVRAIRELHRAAGLWVWPVAVMWGMTGVYLAFPGPVRAMVEAIAPSARTPVRGPSGSGHAAGTAPRLGWLVARARQQAPGAQVARIVMPAASDAPYRVTLARGVHGDWDDRDELTCLLDHDGALVGIEDARERPAGYAVGGWFRLVHAGAVGGWPVRLLWAVCALVLPLLVVSGVVIWWPRTGRR